MGANERPVTLPSGGTAWVVDVRSHAQADILRRHHLRVNRYMTRTRNPDGTSSSDWKPDLSPEEQEAKDDLTLSAGALYIRTLTKRWEGVASNEGEPLTFPDDIERMRDDDMEALASNLLANGEPDPKDDATSGSLPPPAPFPATPI